MLFNPQSIRVIAYFVSNFVVMAITSTCVRTVADRHHPLCLIIEAMQLFH